MVETLTESFCERCGTRYEFKAPTRLNPLRKTRGFIGGLKNYVMSQDALADAMGDAMRSEEDALAAAQLDAFHESFNFCIDCRQYTCVNCWNDDAGRCRSCAPIAGTDDLADRLQASFAQTNLNGAAEHGHTVLADAGLHQHIGPETWPESDLPAGAESWPSADAQPWPSAEPLPQVEPEPIAAETDAEPEPVAAEAEPWSEPSLAEPGFEAWTEPAPEPVMAEVEPEPEPVVAEVEPEAWTETVAAELDSDAFVSELESEAEPELVVAEPAPEPPVLRVVAWEEDADYEVQPMVAEVEPEPEPEPMVAEVEPEPEPPVRPRIAPISETILHFPSRAPEQAPPTEPDAEPVAAEADSPEVAARRAQLDLLGLGDPGQGPVAPERPAVVPYRSRGAAASSAEIAAFRGSSFWEASAREVAGATGHVGVQNCGQCGLSLSANARFCRRCGTRQAQSA